MAIHAADQAVLAFALAVDHGCIALMIEKFHMVAAHDLHRLDALLRAGRFGRLRDCNFAEARNGSIGGLHDARRNGG
ncbi:MAG: hypothetical protein EP300_14685 [Gammaproteobacteria bacterium]|nr:MAG: hypothetical protein EP300_14685 [Gammaproteobacteria bacterium]